MTSEGEPLRNAARMETTVVGNNCKEEALRTRSIEEA